MLNNFIPISNIFLHFREYEDFLFYYAANNPPKDFVMHSHDTCELLFLRKGDLTYNVEGRSYRITKNTLILTRPLERHTLIFNSPDDYERYVFLFDEKKLATDIYSKLPRNLDIIHFDGNALVCGLFKKLEYYLNHLDPPELETVLAHTLQEILYNVRLTAMALTPVDMYTVNPSLNDAIKYIDANILNPITIDKICEATHITKSYLHQLFIKHLQITPGKYILSKKLSIAQRELRAGVKATEVCLTCGFTDYSTFYRDYKKHFGHSPSNEADSTFVREIYFS